ncbi:MAG: putative FmdB family regulatory protein [Pseudohongiellaceae bacterium]|jgi:putative FmdB family regulatory protein
MPIYEYACKSCGFEKDVLQKLSDEPLKTCPECSDDSFVKRISASGFRLKGTGWYETDFKTGIKKNLAGGSDNNQKDNPAS